MKKQSPNILTAELLSAAIEATKAAEDAISVNYQHPVCPGCDGQKERRPGNYFPFPTVCRRCVRRMPKELRERFQRSYGEQHRHVFIEVLTWLRTRRCRRCGCVENDCRQCIEKTGQPCHWVEKDLCSACVPAKTPKRRKAVAA